MQNDIKIETVKGVTEIIYREGDALPPVKPQELEFKGLISAPFDYYAGRISANATFFDLSKSVLIVDKDRRMIQLYSDPNSPLGDVITGTVLIDTMLKQWRINTNESWKPKELSTFLRRNRH